MSIEKQIEEMALIICGFKDCTSCISRMGLRKCGAKAYAERFYSAGYRKQSEWISVDERLPDCCGLSVLMVAVNQYSQTRVVKGFTDYQCPITFRTNEREFDGIWGAWDVTHWMPLPEAPKGGAE